MRNAREQAGGEKVQQKKVNKKKQARERKDGDTNWRRIDGVSRYNPRMDIKTDWAMIKCDLAE